MNYCISYETYKQLKKEKKVELLNKIKEIRIKRKDNKDIKTIEELNTIIKEIKQDNKIPIISIDEENDSIQYKDFIYSFKDIKIISSCLLTAKGQPLHINSFKIKTMPDLKIYTDGEFYIGGDLGFFIQKIKNYKPNLKIRFPLGEVLSSSSSSSSVSYDDFFIRPEDIYLYENLIDTLDFSSAYNTSFEKLLIKAYIEDQKWIGDLSEIIPGIPEGLKGDSILPDFGKRRFNCHRRCVYQLNNCQLCTRYAELSAIARKQNIYFKKQSRE